MNASWVRCSGCNKVFSPRGHSQHVNKTHRASCRTSLSTSGHSVHPHAVSHSPAQTATPLSSNTVLTPPNFSDDRELSQNQMPPPDHEITDSTDATGELFILSQHSCSDTRNR